MTADFTKMSNASMSYVWPGLIKTAAQAEHDGDHTRRAEILADIAAFKAEWSKRDLAALDGSTWPIGKGRWEAKRRDLEAEVTRARKRGGEFWEGPQAVLDAHIELGQSLGYAA